MNNLFLILFLLSLAGIPISLVLSVIRFFQRKATKPTLIVCGILILMSIICFVGFGLTLPAESFSDTTTSTEVTTHEMPENKTGTQENMQIESSIAETTIPITEVLDSKDIFINTLTLNENVLPEAAEKAYSILTEQMGFKDITAEESKGALTVFDVKADSYKLVVTVNDDVYRITCGNYTLYEDGTVHLTKQDLDDRSLNGYEAYYYTIAQEIITNNLKSPKSADFPSIAWNSGDIQMARNGALVAVQSFVDAQNSLGTMIRSKFLVEFRVIDLKAFKYEVVYINIDGTESGEYIELD